MSCVEERRFSARYSSQLDLTRARAELAATEELVPTAELAIACEEDGLSILVGRPPGSIERGKSLDAVCFRTFRCRYRPRSFAAVLTFWRRKRSSPPPITRLTPRARRICPTSSLPCQVAWWVSRLSTTVPWASGLWAAAFLRRFSRRGVWTRIQDELRAMAAVNRMPLQELVDRELRQLYHKFRIVAGRTARSIVEADSGVLDR